MKKFNMLAPISIMVAGIVFSSVIALYACNKAALGTDPGKASFQGGARSPSTARLQALIQIHHHPRSTRPMLSVGCRLLIVTIAQTTTPRRHTPSSITQLSITIVVTVITVISVAPLPHRHPTHPPIRSHTRRP